MGQPDPFDVDALRLPAAAAGGPPAAPPRRLPRHRPGGRFLRGPVPWDWLDRAGRLPGKALLVGLVLWTEAGCERNRTVRFPLSRAAACGIHPDTARRGLRRLEAAGLVRAERPPGRCLIVTILDAPAAGNDGGATGTGTGPASPLWPRTDGVIPPPAHP